MPSSSTLPAVGARDPVAAVIEEQLRDMESEGHGELIVNEEPNVFRMAFAGSVVRAHNYDLALIRLARQLLDDPYCSARLTSRLRRTVALSQI